MKIDKTLFLKWIKNLMYVQCVEFAAYILGQVPMLESPVLWVRQILTIASIYCLYKLAPISDRYQKAVIFSGLAAVMNLLVNAGVLIILSIPLMVCSLIGTWQEFHGHLELLLIIDKKLSDKWHTLLMWNIFGPLIVALITPMILIMPIFTGSFDESKLSQIAVLIGVLFSVILQLLYVIYLKRTHDVYEKYEHCEEA